MFISFGWFWLAGGVLDASRIATTKKFSKSDFANQEFEIPNEDYKTEVKITPLKRWLIVAACTVIAFTGVLLVQRDNNWNPFQPSVESPPTAH